MQLIDVVVPWTIDEAVVGVTDVVVVCAIDVAVVTTVGR